MCRDSVVEALRAIAELMIWGDQHDPRFFDFFLEQNLMRHFSQFLEKGSNRRGEVAKQVRLAGLACVLESRYHGDILLLRSIGLPSR